MKKTLEKNSLEWCTYKALAITHHILNDCDVKPDVVVSVFELNRLLAYVAEEYGTIGMELVKRFVFEETE